jgi:hypothetical protein
VDPNSPSDSKVRVKELGNPYHKQSELLNYQEDLDELEKENEQLKQASKERFFEKYKGLDLTMLFPEVLIFINQFLDH